MVYEKKREGDEEFMAQLPHITSQKKIKIFPSKGIDGV